MLEWDDRNYKLVFNVSNLWSTELFTIQLKILFQEICKLYVGWDDVVNKIPPKWKSVCEFLNSLLVIIDRCYYVYNVVFCEIGAFKNLAKFTGKHLWQSLFFNKVAGLMLVTLVKETLAQVFSCEFWEIFKDHLFCRTPPVAWSEIIFQNICCWTESKISLVWTRATNQKFKISQRIELMQYII